jgi:uncharacterized membrane protein
VEGTCLEAFADGASATAATLLVIDVSVPARRRALGSALLHAWWQYAASAVPVCGIGIKAPSGFEPE